MILLSGHSLTQARKIPLESLSLRLSERESTASMTPVSMDGIGTASWFLDETEPGKGIVWRVRSIQTAYATNTPTVQLEHVISCLKDRILFGSFEASDISGGETATAEQAIRFILSRQSDWRLGRCEYNFAAPYKFDGENLYDAIAKVTGTLDDSWWDLDTSVYPFVINIIRRPAGAACEMRPGRNLSAISRTIDTSGMYTRFYPIGADDLHIGTQFIGQNESAYGVREKVEVDQELTTEAELISWAREKLGKHAQPVINITAEGVELAAATGESLDKLTLGRICRVPLQEFGTIIEERITQLEYSDKIHNPEKVRITMSNARTDRDILHLLADEMKNGGGAGGRGARTSTRKSKEDHAWFEDTDSHVAMVARGIIGTDAHGKPNWERLSRLEVNEDGIYGEVKSVQNDVVLANTRIDQTEDHITLEANKFAEGQAALSARITVEADKITQDVANKTAGLNSKIEQTATSIRQEVSNTAEGLQASIDIESKRIGLVVEGTGSNAKIRPAQIVASINDSGSSILLDADKIRLSGTTTINDVMTVQNGYVHINAPLIVSSGDSGHELMYVNGTLYVNRVAANSVEVPYHLTTRKTLNVSDAQVSGNTLTITYVDGTTVNFSKAASLTGSWSGAVYTAKATPGTQKKTIGFANTADEYLVVNGVDGSEVFDDTTKNITKDYNVQTQDNSQTPPGWITRYTNTINVDGTAAYNAGKDSVSLRGTWSGSVYTAKISTGGTKTIGFSNTADEYLTVQGGSETVSGTYITKEFNVQTQDSSTTPPTFTTRYTGSLIVDGSTVYSNGQTDGWNLARGKVSLPGSGSGGSITAKWPGASYNTQESRTYELATDGNNSVILRYNTAPSGQQPQYTTAARITHYGYNTGFDANHVLFIADADETTQSSISLGPGDTMDIWPGMMLLDGETKKWGSKVTITCSGSEAASIETYSRGWNDYSGQLPSERSITIRGRDANDTSNYDDYTVNLRLYKSGNTVYLQHSVDGSWTSVAMIS